MDFKPFAFVFVLALSLNVARCDAEPRCSKFDFEEKLLEKVVRMEHATNVMMEQFKELSMEVKDSLHKIKENFEEIKVEAKEELKRVKRISEGATNIMMDQFKELSTEVKDSVDKMKEKNEEIKVEAKEELEHVKRLSEEFLEQPSYAFSVMWLLNTNPAVGETLRFSSIALNEKDVYNAYTGEYTVPVNGTYLFTSNLCTHANRWVNIKFMAGSAVIGAFRAADHDWDFCSSSSVISYLTKDTKVKMNVQSKAPSEIFYNAQNNYLSSFSGYLI